MTVPDLLCALSELITRRYTNRVGVALLPVVEDRPGVRLHQLSVRPTAKTLRREIVMSIVGDELPRTMMIRYEPQAKRTSIPVNAEALFTVNGEELTMEVFVRHVFTPWFGGYQVY